MSKLDKICISIVTGVESSSIYSTRDYFSMQRRHLEVVCQYLNGCFFPHGTP